MRDFKKRFVIIQTIMVLIAPIVVGLFPTERAFACSCVVPGTPEEEFKMFDAVFMGTVTGISERPAPDHLSEIDKAFYPKVKIGINVGHSWKGVATDFVYVYTGYGMGDCGYPSTDFETYLFYAYGPIDDLNISTCSRTDLYNNAQEDRIYLEKINELPLMHVAPQNSNFAENNDLPLARAAPQNGDYDGNDQSRVIALLGALSAVLVIAVSYLIVINQKMRKKINSQQ